MKRVIAFGVVAILLVSAPGCGGPDSVMREFIVNLNAYAETVEKKESAEKQLAAIERVKTTLEKIDKLKLSNEERERLAKKYEPEVNKVKERIETAMKNQALEGGAGPNGPNPCCVTPRSRCLPRS